MTDTATSTSRDQFKRLGVLIAVNAVDMLGFAMVLPILPFYAQDLGATPLAIGLIISSYSIAQLISAPFTARAQHSGDPLVAHRDRILPIQDEERDRSDAETRRCVRLHRYEPGIQTLHRAYVERPPEQHHRTEREHADAGCPWQVAHDGIAGEMALRRGHRPARGRHVADGRSIMGSTQYGLDEAIRGPGRPLSLTGRPSYSPP